MIVALTTLELNTRGPALVGQTMLFLLDLPYRNIHLILNEDSLKASGISLHRRVTFDFFFFLFFTSITPSLLLKTE